MTDSSRRQFLTGMAAGLVALQGGLIKTPGAVAADALAADTPTAASNPTTMAIAKWKEGAGTLTNDQINVAAGKLARQAIEGLGGMKRFVKAGETIWIKPNIGWDRTPEQAANVNPKVVAEVVKMCLEAGAKTVKVGDNSCNPARKCYVTSGIAAAAEQAGASVVYLDPTRFKPVDLKGNVLKSLPLHPEILDCDAVINIAILKHHELSQLTMCMKNLMGMADKRPLFHQDIPGCLTNVGLYMKPKIRLHMLDAVRTLKAHGPTGGNLADVDVKMALAASTDGVAIDAWGAELMGHKADEIASVVRGNERGLGKMDYRSLSPKEVAVS